MWMLIVLVLFAAACSNDPDLEDLLADEGIDFGDLAGDGSGIGLDDLTGGGDVPIDADGILEEILGTSVEELEADPFSLFCNDNDLTSLPADWPFPKPPSLMLSGFDTTSTEYVARGTADDIDAVIDEAMNQLWPGSQVEVVVDTETTKSYEFVRDGRRARVQGTNSSFPCWTVSVSLLMGTFDQSTDGAASTSTSAAEGTVADDAAGAGTTTDPSAPMPELVVAIGAQVWLLDVVACQITADQIAVSGTGDAILTVSGSAASVDITFAAADGTTRMLNGVEAIVPLPGLMQIFAEDGGFIVPAANCA